MMMRRMLALLLAALLTCLTPVVLAETAQQEDIPEMFIVNLLQALAKEPDEQKRLEMVAEAAGDVPDNVTVLLSCVELLYWHDYTGAYDELAERLTLRAEQIAQTDEEKLAVLEMRVQQLLWANQAEEAIRLMEDADAPLRDSTGMKMLLASVQYQTGQTEKALETLEAVIEDDPQNLEASDLRATLLLDDFRYEEALGAYRQIDKAWPESLVGLYGQYITSIAMGEFAQGVRLLDQLLAYNMDDSLWLDRARIRLWQQYMPEKALEEADALLRMNPEWMDAGMVRVGALLMLEESEQAHEQVAALAPLDADYADLIDAIVYMNEENWEAAEALLTALVDRSPNAFSAMRNLAAVALDGYGDPAEAMAWMRQAFAVVGPQGSFELFAELGHVYLAQRNPVEAVRAFTAADYSTIEDPSAQYFRVLVFLKAGDRAEMLSALAEMERQYPGWYETMMTRVQVEDALGNAQAALDAFLLAKEKFPHPLEKQVRMEAALYAAAGDKRGIETMAALVADGPTEDRVVNGDAYAYTLLQEGRLDEAQAALDAARTALAEDAELSDVARGQLHVQLQGTQMAIHMARDDVQSAVEAMEAIGDTAWAPGAMLLDPRMEALTKEAAFAKAMAAQGYTDLTWDVTRMPTIPQ